MDPNKNIDGIMLVLYIAVPLILLVGSCVIHALIKRSRNRYLDEQESHFRGRICLTTFRRFPPGVCHNPVLVTGTAVVANNYFVSFIAGFKHIFGGEMKGYTELCTAARRMARQKIEALARDKNIALYPGEAPCDGKYYLDNEKIEDGNVLEIEFRIE